MRRSWSAAAAALACAGCLVVGAAGAPGEALANDCTTGYVCVYPNIWFSGAEGLTVCGAQGAHPFGSWKESGMNHCANRAVWFRVNGVAQTCRNAGGQVEAAGFNEIWIGVLNSTC